MTVLCGRACKLTIVHQEPLRMAGLFFFTHKLSTRHVASGQSVAIRPWLHSTLGCRYYTKGIKTPSTGYEVYVIPYGAGRVVFKLLGDGGYSNWAFNGRYRRDGKTVIFNP